VVVAISDTVVAGKGNSNRDDGVEMFANLSDLKINSIE